jgi:hypothetical protein
MKEFKTFMFLGFLLQTQWSALKPQHYRARLDCTCVKGLCLLVTAHKELTNLHWTSIGLTGKGLWLKHSSLTAMSLCPTRSMIIKYLRRGKCINIFLINCKSKSPPLTLEICHAPQTITKKVKYIMKCPQSFYHSTIGYDLKKNKEKK